MGVSGVGEGGCSKGMLVGSGGEQGVSESSNIFVVGK